MLAIICLTVVLPLLPVTAINGSVNCARQCFASAPNASLVSATMICCGNPASCDTSTPAAPCARASLAKLWPSKFSPTSATNKSPASIERLSVVTRAIAASCAGAPAPSTAAAADKLIISVFTRDSSHDFPARPWQLHGRKMAILCRRFPDSSRALCRRSESRRSATHLSRPA